jgi:outer membrane protein
MFKPRFAALAAAVFAIAFTTTATADVGGYALRMIDDPTGPAGGGNPANQSTAPETPELAAWAGTPTPADLPGLLSTAIKSTPALRSATIDIAIAEARIVEAEGIDDFVLTAELSGGRSTGSILFSGMRYNTIDTSFGADISISRSLSTGGTVSLGASTGYSKSEDDSGISDVSKQWVDTVTAQVTQPLLRGRGAAIARAQQARAQLSRDVSVLARRQVAIDAVQTVIAAYWDLALAERQLAIRRAGLDLIAERRRLTEAGINGGKVAPSELLAVEQAVATQQEQILSAEVAVVQQSINVRRATGMSIEPGAIALASGAQAGAPAKTATLEQSLQRAFATSPELAQLAVQDKDATIEVQLAENGLLPQLDAALRLGPTGRGTSFSAAGENLVKFDEYTIVGTLTFQYELGHHAATGASRAARLSREKLQVTATDVKAQIAQAVAQEVAVLELAARRVALAQTAIDLAKKNIEVEQARFSLGKSTNFDVLQRQNELQSAELSKASAEIDARKAEAALAALTGDLLAEYGIDVDAKPAAAR